MILGHLVPAGTGFRIHQEAQVRIHDDALREQKEAKERILAARMDLLNESADSPDVIAPRPDVIAPRPDVVAPRPAEGAPSSIADLSPDIEPPAE